MNAEPLFCTHMPKRDQAGDEKSWCVACLRDEVKELRKALALLWEEATDESRCATEALPGVYEHWLSMPCRTVVQALLKGDKP